MKNSASGDPGRVPVVPESTEELTEIFTIAALESGNMAKATRIVNEDREKKGLALYRPDTLRERRRQNRELYEKISKEVTERVRRNAAEKHIQIADEAMEIESELDLRLTKALDDIPARDLAGAKRNVATAGAIHTDKALALVGDSPSGVQVNVNIGDTIRNLAGRGTPLYDADGNKLSVDEALKQAQPAIEGEAEEVVSVDN